jgi:hypothetical protein
MNQTVAGLAYPGTLIVPVKVGLTPISCVPVCLPSDVVVSSTTLPEAS